MAVVLGACTAGVDAACHQNLFWADSNPVEWWNSGTRPWTRSEAVALSTADDPVGVENLNGTVDITNDHLDVTKMVGQVGGGQVSVGGSIAYRPNMQFNLALQGNGVRLRYPDGLRSLLD